MWFDRAAPIARALSLIARARSTSTLRARSGGRTAVFHAHAGRLLRIEAPGSLFGEVLASGARASEIPVEPNEGETIGAALVRVGAIDDHAVETTLRRQMKARLRRVMSWPDTQLSMEPATAPGTPPGEGICARDLVLAALRDLAETIPLDVVRERLGRGPLALAPLGELLVDRSALFADEAAACARLRHPATLPELERAARGSERALRMVFALAELEAATPPVGNGSLALLARKSRETRGTSAPAALLDLPQSAAPQAARPALRRIAREIHPDRFGPDAPPAIVAASNAVLGALGDAARSHGRGPPR